MSREFELTPNKTYASKDNVRKAVNRVLGADHNYRFFIMPTENGRFFPVFVGQDALQGGVHFHFNVTF